MSFIDDLIHRGEAPPTDELADVPPGDGEAPRTRKPRSDKGIPRGQRSSGGRRPSMARIREQVAGLVATGNLIVAKLAPADVLSDDEMDLLTDALAAEAATNQRIVRWLGRASGMSAHFLLLSAIVTIAIPRLQRRGILPAATGGTHDGAVDASVPVETRGTYGDNWRHGLGENDTRKPANIGAFPYPIVAQ